MKLEQYHTLTQQLQQNLESRADVIGLIALGSMAGTTRQPDEYSDHDFFVITETGKQQNYRNSNGWLPYPERLVLHFQETDHGCKAIYDNGHILEYAIFDLDELRQVHINSYNVLFDKANITDLMPSLQQVEDNLSVERVFDSMLSNILVGAMRNARGETLSAHAFIKQYALRAFMLLCWHQLAPDSPHADNLDPFRRFEREFPELSDDLMKITLLPNHQAALALLQFCESVLAPTLADNRSRSIKVIRDYILSLDESFASE